MPVTEENVGFNVSEFAGSFILGKLTRGTIYRLARACLGFCEALANTTLYRYQRDFGLRIILSILLDDGEEITGLFARQSGKSETLAVIINGMLVLLPLLARYIKDPRIQKFKKGFWVGIFAPAYEQSNIIYSRLLSRIHSDHAKSILSDDEIGIFFDDERETASMNLPNGSRADCNSAARQARIEGKTYHLIIIEEAQDVDPYIYKKSISPMGAATNASQVKIGTCNMRRSDFYEACQRNAKRDSKRGKGALQLHYQYDYEISCKYNAFYRKYIAKEIDRLGFDSDEFRLSYRLHWILERGMFVEPTAFAIMGKDYSVVTYDNKNPLVVGIDVGKIDASTVVTVIQPDMERGQRVGPDDYRAYKRILNWLELQGDDYPLQLRQITDFLAHYHKKYRIMVDCTGVGEALYDMLVDYYDEQLQKEEFEMLQYVADQQKNHDLYHRLLLDLQSYRIEYPNSERAKKLGKQRAFVAQMTNLQKMYKGAFLSAEAGDATPYKDYCSSLAIACLCCDTHDSFGSIEEVDSPFFSRGRYPDEPRRPRRERPEW